MGLFCVLHLDVSERSVGLVVHFETLAVEQNQSKPFLKALIISNLLISLLCNMTSLLEILHLQIVPNQHIVRMGSSILVNQHVKSVEPRVWIVVQVNHSICQLSFIATVLLLDLLLVERRVFQVF